MERILIVGFGSMGKTHLEIARKLFPNSKIFIYRHKKNDFAPDLADKCIYSISEIRRFKPQFSVIANPASHHLDFAKLLINVNSKVLIEKPISDSLAGVKELINLTNMKSIDLFIGYNLRFSPSLREFISILKSGILGEIFSIRCEVGQNLLDWRPNSDYRTGVSAQKKLGGGVLLELSHELDFLLNIFGEIISVSSIVSKQSDLDIDVEDSAHVILKFAPSNFGKQIIGSIGMDFIRKDATRVYTAVGNFGSLKWDGIAGSVELFIDKNKTWEKVFFHKPNRLETYLFEWKEIFSNSEKANIAHGIDGLRVLQLIEAVKEASFLNKKVIPSIDPK